MSHTTLSTSLYNGPNTIINHLNSLRNSLLSTILLILQNSLSDLMSKFKSADPHFIRCIKPNMRKHSGVFDGEYVKAQLGYTGILETVRIRQQGYALRIGFQEFIDRFDYILYFI